MRVMRRGFAVLLYGSFLAGCSQNLVVFNDTSHPIEVDFIHKDVLRAPQLRRLRPDEAISSHACTSDVALIYVRLEGAQVFSLAPDTLCQADKCGCEVKGSQLIRMSTVR